MWLAVKTAPMGLRPPSPSTGTPHPHARSVGSKKYPPDRRGLGESAQADLVAERDRHRRGFNRLPSCRQMDFYIALAAPAPLDKSRVTRYTLLILTIRLVWFDWQRHGIIGELYTDDAIHPIPGRARSGAEGHSIIGLGWETLQRPSPGWVETADTWRGIGAHTSSVRLASPPARALAAREVGTSRLPDG